MRPLDNACQVVPAGFETGEDMEILWGWFISRGLGLHICHVCLSHLDDPVLCSLYNTLAVWKVQQNLQVNWVPSTHGWHGSGTVFRIRAYPMAFDLTLDHLCQNGVEQGWAERHQLVLKNCSEHAELGREPIQWLNKSSMFFLKWMEVFFFNIHSPKESEQTHRNSHIAWWHQSSNPYHLR